MIWNNGMVPTMTPTESKMANNNPTSIYPQFLQLRKNQFRHSINKQLEPTSPSYGAKKASKVQGDTPDNEAQDMQKAQGRSVRKMGANAYKGELSSLLDAYGSYGGDGDSGTFGSKSNKGGSGGGFGGNSQKGGF